MEQFRKYRFNLPLEEEVIKRNRTITTYYAQLYQNEPELYKWAGMAAFASFHIGEKLQLWNWNKSGIKSFSNTCKKKNRTIEDDFQIIRIINNQIFAEIGWVHLSFSQMDYPSFHSLLLEKKKHTLIIAAFDKLNNARTLLYQDGYTSKVKSMIWEANTEILWHEQSQVVQPLFDKLSKVFSRAMSFFASFDYKINHRETSWKTRSRFILFMLFNGFSVVRKNWLLPEVTDLQHRWHWISNDILVRWKKVESNQKLITKEIEWLSQIEHRNLSLKKYN